MKPLGIRCHANMSAEERRTVSELTRQRMADPVVRRRISECTRQGKAKADGSAAELHLLKAGWAAARPSARQEFLLPVIRTDEEAAP